MQDDKTSWKQKKKLSFFMFRLNDVRLTLMWRKLGNFTLKLVVFEGFFQVGH